MRHETNLFQDLESAGRENDHRPLLHHRIAIPPQADGKVVPRRGVGKGSSGGVDPHFEGGATEAHAPDLFDEAMEIGKVGGR